MPITDFYRYLELLSEDNERKKKAMEDTNSSSKPTGSKMPKTAATALQK